jgi:broad specificity phosphatase PhoE
LTGRQQAFEVGKQLKSVGITKILSSPLIRTVMTADIIADVLGLGENSICVELSLVEEAKSFRGKTAAEPRPNWNPLILPVSELQKYSNRIDVAYEPIMHVSHVRDEEALNTIREVHEHLTDRDEISKDRYRVAVRRIITADKLDGEIVLCVAHGASVKHCTKELETDLPEEFQCQGERSVSCYTEFQPFDENNPSGPWRSVYGEWRSGDVAHIAVDNAADRGDQV